MYEKLYLVLITHHAKQGNEVELQPRSRLYRTGGSECFATIGE
jgi:hypothetical protein